MKRFVVICVLAAAFLLSGCFVFPHRTNLTPTILGEILHQETGRVRVSVSEANTCQGAKREATINEHGRFVLEPLREWNALVLVMAHRFFPWQFCVQERGEWRLWHSAQDYTLADIGPAWVLILRCAPGEQPGCVEEPRFDVPRNARDRWLEHGSLDSPAAQQGAAADVAQRVPIDLW